MQSSQIKRELLRSPESDSELITAKTVVDAQKMLIV